jgi:hypothetical protein
MSLADQLAGPPLRDRFYLPGIVVMKGLLYNIYCDDGPTKKWLTTRTNIAIKSRIAGDRAAPDEISNLTNRNHGIDKVAMKFHSYTTKQSLSRAVDHVCADRKRQSPTGPIRQSYPTGSRARGHLVNLIHGDGIERLFRQLFY